MLVLFLCVLGKRVKCNLWSQILLCWCLCVTLWCEVIFCVEITLGVLCVLLTEKRVLCGRLLETVTASFLVGSFVNVSYAKGGYGW